MRRILAVLGLAMAVVLAACGNDGPRLPQATRSASSEASRPSGESSDQEAGTGESGPSTEPRCGATDTPGLHVGSFAWSGGERAVRVYVPAAAGRGIPLPLVLNFHGYGNSAEAQEAYSNLIPLAEAEGFILVTPDGGGFPAGWNIIGVYDEYGEDDVQFVSELLDSIEGSHCVDLARVFATGFSNGAEMAAQVACLLPDRVAAIAAVAGLVYQGCEPRDVAILAFHGTDDFNVPFELAAGSAGEWAQRLECAGVVEEQLTDHVRRTSYVDCVRGDVQFYVVDGGGHTWPGAEPDAGGAGPVTGEINANEVLWAFFLAHARP